MADVLRAFEEHRQTVYRLALHHTGSVHDAEDICQSAFLRLAEHADRVGDAAAKAWLIRVTINLCRDHARERMRHGTEEIDETIAAPQEDREVLQKVMELPEKDRAVVYLYYFEGYSTSEIARLTHTTQTAVSTRLARAREKLKRELEELP
ncbi:MAG: sigma-70 family RNA polymerase sigma factor [Ruminococcaceae bacterium]|nr:sigma-70 family RNA polymerase sigma factor [Oscillospiraceae bacterium]